MKRKFAWATAAMLATLLPGCADDDDSGSHDSADADDHDDHDDDDDDDHGHDDEVELITDVVLTFTPDSGDAVTAAFSDPDGAGGMSGTTDPISLAADTTYELAITISNSFENEDVTEEIREEAEEHQVFVYGASVMGPASTAESLVTHTYSDVESDYGENAVGDDLPVGLVNGLATNAAGAGELRVMLRHLPELNGSPQKVAGLAEAFAAGDAIAGDVDFDVRFDLTVE